MHGSDLSKEWWRPDPDKLVARMRRRVKCDRWLERMQRGEQELRTARGLRAITARRKAEPESQGLVRQAGSQPPLNRLLRPSYSPSPQPKPSTQPTESGRTIAHRDQP